jgi:hypothetical protein
LGVFALFSKNPFDIASTHFNNEDLPFLPNTSLEFIITQYWLNRTTKWESCGGASNWKPHSPSNSRPENLTSLEKSANFPVFTLSLGLLSQPNPSSSGIRKVRKFYWISVWNGETQYEMLNLGI